MGAIPPNTIMTRPVLTARVYDFLMKSQVRCSGKMLPSQKRSQSVFFSNGKKPLNFETAFPPFPQEPLFTRPNTAFKLFESEQFGESDLLFKDATNCFVHTSHMDYRSILGGEFYSHLEKVFNCTHSGEASETQKVSALTMMRPYLLRLSIFISQISWSSATKMCVAFSRRKANDP